jgi:thiol-disulfide isomerase/thioredoxin
MKPLIFAIGLLPFVGLNVSIRAGSIGDVAPMLTVERWIKGTPVRIGPGTNILVVDFWATWCGPCRKGIPELTAVQKRFADKGVIVIGISDEPPAKVAEFVAAQGAGMDYRVAVDSSKRSMKDWHAAFGATSIPHAFIVGTNGIVLWHDNPLGTLEKTLERVVNGTFDIERARNYETGDRYVKQYTAMVSKPNAAEKAAPLGEKILAEHTQDWRVPNRLARAILTDPQVRSRDLPLALRAATKSVELTRRQASDALEMLARAQFATGSKSEALATANEAIKVCRDASDLNDLQQMIALYEKAGAAGAQKR